MYEAFFGLRERPFDLTPNPRFLVLTEAHREAFRNLEYGIASRKGITLLVGEAGSGKTTIIRSVVERLPMRVHSVQLCNPTLSRDEFVEMLAAQFGLPAGAGQSKTSMLLELESLLRARLAAGESTVLVVDEAQSLPLELLEEIRLLANIETNDQKLLTVILAGQPELAERLNTQPLRQFKQRVALRCDLRPLNAEETAGYIVGRIKVAGGDGGKVFTREAVSLMHECSGGLPRTIGVIADNAMIGGFAAGERPVTSRIVRDVCGDFDFEPEAPKLPSLIPARAPMPRAAVAAEPASAPPASAPPEPARKAVGAPSPAGADLFGSFAPKRRFSLFRR